MQGKILRNDNSNQICGKNAYVREMTEQKIGANFLLLLHKYTLWHYRLWSFKTRDTKLERLLHKNQHTQWKLLNFENWTETCKNQSS